jgi:hypothetical protein
MARRAQQLLDRCNALYQDFEKLMPKQYLKPTNDPLGLRWREADDATYDATEALLDCVRFLVIKAEDAEKRSSSAASKEQERASDAENEEPRLCRKLAQSQES